MGNYNVITYQRISRRGATFPLTRIRTGIIIRRTSMKFYLTISGMINVPMTRLKAHIALLSDVITYQKNKSSSDPFKCRHRITNHDVITYQ